MFLNTLLFIFYDAFAKHFKIKKENTLHPESSCLFAIILRHRWRVYFRPRYTINSLLKRKGACKKCGQCCRLNGPACAHFDGECRIYDKQPFFCKIFPIDEKDKQMLGVDKVCGYY